MRAGTRYGKQVAGVVEWFTTKAALAHLARLCRCSAGAVAAGDPLPVPSICREGQRALRPGANCWVQLKAKAGTRRSKAVVVQPFEDGTVRLMLVDDRRTVVVPADEWLTGRSGTTKAAV